MKTFAHINSTGDIVGIGMIYTTDGNFVSEVSALVEEHGEDVGILAYGNEVLPHLTTTDANGNTVDLGIDPSVSTVLIKTTEMPNGTTDGRFDKTFRNAFKHGGGHKVDVDMPKAKEIAHDKRRRARDVEMTPLDIEATIPAKANQAEAKRQIIRDKYAVVQTDIDAAATPSQLKTIIENFTTKGG